MSQKTSTKTMSGNSTKTLQKTNTSQSKILKKSDEISERKTNKSIKNAVKTVNTGIDRMKTNLTTNDMKKKAETSSKPISNQIKTISKPLSKNTKTPIQSNLKSNELNLISKSTKNNSISKKDETLKKNVIQSQRKHTNLNQKSEKVNNNKDIPPQNGKKQTIIIKNEDKKPMESEDQTNKESSDEQYVSLATLESYSSYKKPKKSTESILAEPPSICDTDIDEMINNITDNQINDDFPSDYCDDFEEYESDFEDDDDVHNEEEEEEDKEEEQKEYKPKDLMENNFSEQNEKILITENNDNKKEINLTSDLKQSSNKRENNSFNTITESVKSAKSKRELETQRNKVNKRSKELLEIIKLDEISFTNFDLPPINYELFIKTFGRKDTKQVSCQTSEREDNETQTDSVQISDKWSQNPSFTRLVSGNENQLKENDYCNEFEAKVNPFELIHFLNRAETLMSAIIDIESNNHFIKNKRLLPEGADKFSTNVSVIKCLSLAKKCPISYTFINSLYLFCVQNVNKTYGSAEKSVISVWSLMSVQTDPIKVLICRSHIVKAFSQQNLVVSAMIDGSVALWDLNQQSIYDKEFFIENNKFMLTTPSYNCVLTSKGHDYPIVDIKKLFDSESNDKLTHFGTIDEKGILIVWAIIEGKDENNDSFLTQTSEYKITRLSSKSYLDTIGSEFKSVTITAFECQPNDWLNFYCGTDNGSIIRFTRIEESVNNLPKVYQKSHLNSIWTKVSVISFNDLEINKFLVAFSDGLISYYSISNENPLFVFNSNEVTIIDLKWIPDSSRMAFIALNNSNQILIWDLNSEQNFSPIVKYRHSNDKLLSISLWKGIKTFLVFGCDSGQNLVFDFRI